LPRSFISRNDSKKKHSYTPKHGSQLMSAERFDFEEIRRSKFAVAAAGRGADEISLR
jgi:hypothetical protein